MGDIPGIVYVLTVVVAALAGVWWGKRYSEAQETHVCTGCYENEIEECGSLCVDCRFDAEQATGRAWPAIDEARRQLGGGE